MTMPAFQPNLSLPAGRRRAENNQRRGRGVADSGTRRPPMPMPSASGWSTSWYGLGRGLAVEVALERLLVVGMPARQRRPVLDDVARGPGDASLVDCARDLVVGAEDV